MTSRARPAGVVLLTTCFPPETFAGANRAAALARTLSETHRLVVVTLQPSYPDPDCFAPDAAAAFDRQAGFEVRRRFRLNAHRSRSAATRAGKEQLVAAALAARGLRRRVDVVIATSPSMFLGPMALLLARLRGARFVWDLRDITWDVAGELVGRSGRRRPLAWILQAVMWSTARRCDLVVATTPGIEQLAQRAGVARSRIVTIENGVSELTMAAIRRARPPVAKERPVVTYVGLVGHAQRLGVLVDVAAAMPDVDFVIAGDGPERAAIEERTRDQGVGNLEFLGYVEPEALPDLYQRSDIMFAQVIDSPTLNSTARPSKVLEYMAAGRPVVYAGHGVACEFVEATRCGLSAPPGNASGIVKALRSLLDDPAHRAELGRNAAGYADAVPSREERFRELAATLAAEGQRSR